MKHNLTEYKRKRNFSKTKEPDTNHSKVHQKLHFVIQHHLARKDHYDFRLEWKGVLKSWAIPKGPSYHTSDKRLAIHVEDHPYSYRNFEGTIPKGQYGGGTVMIFDEGFYEPLGNFEQDYQKGNIKFFLKGKRLQGFWSLVYFNEDNWLLIKEKDSFLGFSDIKKYDTSIKTGRTMREIEQKQKSITSKKDAIVENIEITHPQKKIFERPNISKLDIALYYQKVAKRMMPFLHNRLISTIRCPDGIKGEQFFKKHFQNNHSGIGKIHIPNEHDHKEDYYYIKNVGALISEVQMNSFEFHTWGCNIWNLDHPDMLVFDLDPDEGMTLQKIRQGVRDLKSVLDELALTSFLKTSGGKGYHVVVPIHSLKTWEEFREFARNIAKLMEAKWPNRYISNVRKERRKGKIFIDWIRNTKSATSVAPYSIRCREKAFVSMPISWRELDKVKPNGITMKEAIKRLKKKDPWENFFFIDQ